MSLLALVLVIGVVVIAVFVRMFAFIPTKDACRYLQQGGAIVDVRTPEEFQERHVPNAINLPLSGLPSNVLDRFPNRDQVLLLHCLGGGRSTVAQRRLRAMGYVHAYNLGSFPRALRVASEHDRMGPSVSNARTQS
jgi:phage shock protein E